MAKQRKGGPAQIRLRSNTNIGALDAESDEEFLEHCFIDTGDLELLKDTKEPKCMLLGRTGSGKTALLKRVRAECENVIEIRPESLSLQYIANSNVIQFFEGAGVSLEPFYQLLWRHVIVVELLKKKYNIVNNKEQANFLDWLQTRLVGNRAKIEAINYLREWGEKFWQETEYRVQELTQKIETDLGGAVEVDGDILKMGAKGAQRLEEGVKGEIIERGKRVMNEVQVKKLHEVIDLLAQDIFTDNQQKYYIVIDRLDEDWADDWVRYRFIKSLFEAVKTFRRVQPLKIIVAVRSDLLQRVLRTTASAGFQEEKYESMYLPVRWPREHLIELMDRRVNYMFNWKYTKQNVSMKDIMPTNQIDKKSVVDYIIDRSFDRPREVIQFMNECIGAAAGQSRINIGNIKTAEISYSRKRLTSLADEWRADFPLLPKYTRPLSQSTPSFCINDFSDEKWEEFGTMLLSDECPEDPLYVMAERVFLAGTIPLLAFTRRYIQILYQVGLIGVKINEYTAWQWSYIDEPYLVESQVKESMLLKIHPAFWLALGISDK